MAALPAKAKRKLPERFTAKLKVMKKSGCWQWQGAAQRGRAYCWWQGRAHTAYRVVYALLVGKIKKGHELHHKCRNPMCCNPAHLQPLTAAEHTKLHHREEAAALKAVA